MAIRIGQMETKPMRKIFDKNKSLKAEGINLAWVEEIRETYLNYQANLIDYVDTTTADIYENRVTFTIKPFALVAELEELGAGNFSTVFAISDTLALKINKQRDTGYWAFAQFCRDNYKEYDCLPRILYCEDWGNNIYAYVIERLERGSRYDREIVSNIASNILLGYSNDFGQESRITIIPESFFKTCEELRAFYTRNRGNFGVDLHADNVMFRGNIPIITDPFC